AFADAFLQDRAEQERNGRSDSLFELFARQAMRVLQLWALMLFMAAGLVTGPLRAQGLPVTYEHLLKADQEPGNWLMYSNTYNSWRFSRLDQINTENVN